ncbi:MAG: general secretion pathway protein GspF [Rhizobacter sp.]|nr:general secretion pathway protein GspF [Bacteriovorax sp.]
MTENKKDPNAPLKHENHSLHTRRDFLSQGFLAGVGFTMIPGLLTMLHSNAANALECGLGDTTNITRVPIIIFDLSGGGNLVGSNVMVGKAGGQMDFISSYETLGLPMTMHPKNAGQTNNELGLVFHNDSAILRGIKNSSTVTTRAKVEGGVFCATSNDDTQNNPHNPMYWLASAGVTGQLAPLAGTVNSDSGGNSMAPQSSLIATLKPVTLNTPKDALGLVNIGRLGTLYGTDKAQKVLKSIENMSAQKISLFNKKALPDQIKDLMNCGYIQSQDLLNRFSVTAVDPTLDPLVTNIFPNIANNADQRKTATMAKLILDGYIGVGTVEKGGFDYHDNTRSSGETRDFEIGDLIGKVMELAAAKGKDIMIYVYSDGGIASSGATDDSTGGRGKIPWAGDSSQRSSAFTLLYRNAGKATLRVANKRQIGAFKDNGTVDTQAMLTSNSVTNLAKALVANYLSLTGDEAKLAKVVGDNPFGTNINDYLFFNKIK